MTAPSTRYSLFATRSSGFTLVELLISIFILMLISTASVVSLRGTREKEELNTAARLLAGDIRNIQARALAASNILTCETAGGEKKVCEDENPSLEACADACAPLPPSRFGVSLEVGDAAFDLFADIDPTDWRRSNDREILVQRDLNPLGGDKVVVSALLTDIGTPLLVNIAVGRQNGTMRIDACGDMGLPACDPTEPKTLAITLRHQTSDETATVNVNAVTGRISIE